MILPYIFVGETNELVPWYGLELWVASTLRLTPLWSVWRHYRVYVCSTTGKRLTDYLPNPSRVPSARRLVSVAIQISPLGRGNPSEVTLKGPQGALRRTPSEAKFTQLETSLYKKSIIHHLEGLENRTHVFRDRPLRMSVGYFLQS